MSQRLTGDSNYSRILNQESTTTAGGEQGGLRVMSIHRGYGLTKPLDEPTPGSHTFTVDKENLVVNSPYAYQRTTTPVQAQGSLVKKAGNSHMKDKSPYRLRSMLLDDMNV